MGLWEGIPDFDSVHTLGANPSLKIKLPEHNFLLARGQYYPMCGMNLCFKREIAPLMYFPLMGDGQPFRRFDDIWCGVIAKKVMDHLNLLISVGKPFVCHKKASNVFTNLVKEAPGIAANEHFWETIDSIPLTEDSVFDCMIEIGEGLEASEDSYLKKLGQAILTWISLYSNP
jgi:reversibly glycosylated polypeptide/UDP-arabinopyranose mutase